MDCYYIKIQHNFLLIRMIIIRERESVVNFIICVHGLVEENANEWSLQNILCVSLVLGK